MGKITYVTVKRYAEIVEKSEKTIYTRINMGKLGTIPEPGGGKGKLIPVCNCEDNLFPGKALCPACEEIFAEKQVF